MASADQVYVDPSALRALYVADPRSRSMARWRMQLGGVVALTRFGYAELINAIALGQFRGSYGEAECIGAIQDVQSDLAEGRLRWVDLLWRAALERSASLSQQYGPRLGTRSMDVVHVASALELGVKQFVTYDQRQARLAQACGLTLIQP